MIWMMTTELWNPAAYTRRDFAALLILKIPGKIKWVDAFTGMEIRDKIIHILI